MQTIIIVIALGILYLSVGLYASRRVSSYSDYFLADRRLGFWQITATLIATQIGGALILGTADAVYHQGIYGLFFALGIALALFILASGLAGKLRAFEITTIPELFITHYNSPALRYIAAALLLLSLTGVLAAQMLAAEKVLFALGVEQSWLLILFWILVIIYTMLGGLRAVVATDIVQLLIVLFVFVLIFGRLQVTHPMTQLPWLSTQLSNTHNIPWLNLLIMPIFFNVLEQDLAQRFFAAKNPRIACWAAACAGFVILLFALIPGYFGLLARQLVLTLSDGQTTLLTVFTYFQQPWMMTILVLALLAAIVSSADSLLCAMSANVSHDFLQAWNSRWRDDVFWPRVITGMLGLVALFIAFCFDDILVLLVHSLSLSVDCLAIPVFACFWLKQCKWQAAAAAMLVGLFGFIAAHIYQFTWINDLLVLVVSLVVYVFVTRRLERRLP